MLVIYQGRVLASKVKTANTFILRLKGLIGKKELEDGEGLLLMGCPSIHCFFMKISIDAVYLSRDMTVLGVETLSPWKIGKRIKGTAHVLELSAGIATVEAGNKLELYSDSAASIYFGGKTHAGIEQ